MINAKAPSISERFYDSANRYEKEVVVQYPAREDPEYLRATEAFRRQQGAKCRYAGR